MPTQPTLTPARAARRQLLLDRVTEYLTDRCGSEDRARAYAADIRDIIENLGWTLPAALDDPPPARPAASSHTAREAAMAQIRADLAAAKNRHRDTP